MNTFINKHIQKLNFKDRRKSHISMYILIIVFVITLLCIDIYTISKVTIPNAKYSHSFEDTFKKYEAYKSITTSEKWNYITKTYNADSIPHWYFTQGYLYKLAFNPLDYSTDILNELDDIVIAKTTYGLNNYIVSTRFNPQNTGEIGIVFKYKDYDNFYKAIMYESNNTLVYEIQRKENGKYTSLQKTTSTVKEEDYFNKWQNFSLEVDTNISLFVNNKKVIQIENYDLTIGRTGIYSHPSTTSYIDTFKILENQSI